MTKIALVAALGLIALSSTANAQGYGHGHGHGYGRGYGDATGERREAFQEHRIEQARRSGQLTGREYRELQAEQARIDALQRRATADGRVDRHEAEQIRRAQNEAGRHIRQEATDNERRGSWGGGWGRRWW